MDANALRCHSWRSGPLDRFGLHRQGVCQWCRTWPFSCVRKQHPMRSEDRFFEKVILFITRCYWTTLYHPHSCGPHLPPAIPNTPLSSPILDLSMLWSWVTAGGVGIWGACVMERMEYNPWKEVVHEYHIRWPFCWQQKGNPKLTFKIDPLNSHFAEIPRKLTIYYQSILMGRCRSTL